jgi:predicted DNA binding CopG/RHH family protein
MKKLKKIPKFKSEDEERDFWATHSSVDYVDWSKGFIAKFPNLKPTTESISIRFPVSLLTEIKILANKKDIPYQSLIKLFVSEKLEELQKLNQTIFNESNEMMKSSNKHSLIQSQPVVKKQSNKKKHSNSKVLV